MYILGINLSHHASVCLLKDGQVIYYLEDDRLSHNKEEYWTPFSSFRSLLKIKEITSSVDYVSMCSFGRLRISNPILDARFSDQELMDSLLEKMEEIGITYGEKIFFQEHHLLHAANAFYSTSQEDGVAIVLDGGGYWSSESPSHRELESVFKCGPEGLTPISKHYGIRYDTVIEENRNKSLKEKDLRFTNIKTKVNDQTILSPTISCGGMFKLIGSLVGIPPSGKVMGLSPYGQTREASPPFFRYCEALDTYITNDQAVFDYVQSLVQNTMLSGFMNGEVPLPDKMHLCRVLQDETFKHTSRIIEKAINTTGAKSLFLSGGYSLNCVNNYRYTRAFPEIDFYVDPLAHDGGTAMGVARYVWHVLLGNKERHPLKHLYLG